MRRKINIAIAEDHVVLRKGIVGILEKYEDMHVLFEANDGKELLDGLKVHKPAIVLLDISMPLVNGVSAMGIMKQYFPEIKIIVMSVFSDDVYVQEYVKLGANSVLPKGCSIDTLVSAIYSVYKHGTYFEERISKLLAQEKTKPFLPKALTERETLILKGFVASKTNAEIARMMGISEKTVDWYKHKIMYKTNTGDLKELIAYALKNKLA